MSATAVPISQTVITGVDFVCVPTADFDRATAFYGDVLGLRQSAQWGSMPAAEFETGSLTLAIMQSDAFGQEFRPKQPAHRPASHRHRRRSRSAQGTRGGVLGRPRLRRLPSGRLQRPRRQPARPPPALRPQGMTNP